MTWIWALPLIFVLSLGLLWWESRSVAVEANGAVIIEEAAP